MPGSPVDLSTQWASLGAKIDTVLHHVTTLQRGSSLACQASHDVRLAGLIGCSSMEGWEPREA